MIFLNSVTIFYIDRQEVSSVRSCKFVIKDILVQAEGLHLVETRICQH